MPNTQRLDLLRELREQAGLSQEDAARLCGLTGRQSRLTVGAWERGDYAPDERRRTRLIGYLWDHLRLRQEPQRFAQVWEMLVEEWRWLPLEEVEWRGLTNQPRPRPTEEVDGQGRARTEPEAQVPPFQPPASTSHFVGRTDEIALLCEQLRQRQPLRIYALVGMGGVGKSTLGVQLAHRLRHDFHDGVLWAYAATSEPLDILNSWARSYGYDFSGLNDVHSRAAALRGVLANKQVLLVLDDVTSAQRVQPLLPGGVTCAVLLTTRNEEVAVALNAVVMPLPELAPAESLQLLHHILGKTRVEAEAAAGEEICRLLHHLPLAVEIAAQFLATRPRRRLAELVNQLREAQNRLDLKISDRDVRTSLAVSWTTLDATQRHVFAHMAVFAGRSFTVAALAAVAGLDVATAQDRLDALQALSLVAAAEADRYRQHPLLADFAGEQLGDSPQAWVRLAEYYQCFVQHHRRDYASLEPEWDNILAGMRTAHTLQQWSLVLTYAEGLTEPWFTRARYTQARQGYSWACVAAEALADQQKAAFCLCKWGIACLEQDDYAEAEARLMEALTLSQAADDVLCLADIHYRLAAIALELAQYDKTEQHLLSSQHFYTQAHHVAGLAKVFYQTALLNYDRGQLQRAATLCQQARALQETAANQTDLIPTLRLAADIAIELQDYAVAANACEQALELGKQLDNRGELAATYYSLAVIARLQQQLDEALTYAEQAFTHFAVIGDRGFAALALYEQSQIYALRREFTHAQQLGQKSLSLFRELHQHFNLIYVLRHLGTLHHTLGENKQAYALWSDALALAEARAHPLTSQLRQQLAKLDLTADVDSEALVCSSPFRS